MPTSRRLWGWVVFAIGLLWLLGGIAAVLQIQPVGWLFGFCGVVLLRLGWNLTHREQP